MKTHPCTPPSSRSLNVIFLPDWSKSNPYLNLLKEGVESKGCIVQLSNFTSHFFPLYCALRKYERSDILHIHWIDPLLEPIFWSQTEITRRIKILLLAVDILIVRLLGTKVIWTI